MILVGPHVWRMFDDSLFFFSVFFRHGHQNEAKYNTRKLHSNFHISVTKFNFILYPHVSQIGLANILLTDRRAVLKVWISWTVLGRFLGGVFYYFFSAFLEALFWRFTGQVFALYFDTFQSCFNSASFRSK